MDKFEQYVNLLTKRINEGTEHAISSNNFIIYKFIQVESSFVRILMQRIGFRYRGY